MLRTLLLAGTAVLSLSAAQAKTLVYCSEGSPENFNPQLNTTGTTFDATHPVYGRLVEFKPASVEIEPGLAERWDVSEDGKAVTFHLRHGVKWQSNATFKPTREFNCSASTAWPGTTIPSTRCPAAVTTTGATSA